MQYVMCKMSLTPVSKIWLKADYSYATQFWLGIVSEQLSPFFFLGCFFLAAQAHLGTLLELFPPSSISLALCVDDKYPYHLYDCIIYQNMNIFHFPHLSQSPSDQTHL